MKHEIGLADEQVQRAGHVPALLDTATTIVDVAKAHEAQIAENVRVLTPLLDKIDVFRGVFKHIAEVGHMPGRSALHYILTGGFTDSSVRSRGIQNLIFVN
jgi:hypothetical protein